MRFRLHVLAQFPVKLRIQGPNFRVHLLGLKLASLMSDVRMRRGNLPVQMMERVEVAAEAEAARL